MTSENFGKNIKKIIPLFIFVSICLFAGILGSFFTTPAIPNWYDFLQKPWLNPPSWIFAPVWTLLYILMGISAFLVWEKRPHFPLVFPALFLFFCHLIINTAWSFVFFGMKDLFLSLMVIGILWIFIVILIGIFSKIEKKAALLLIPYWLWVSFASYLNFALWQMN